MISIPISAALAALLAETADAQPIGEGTFSVTSVEVELNLAVAWQEGAPPVWTVPTTDPAVPAAVGSTHRMRVVLQRRQPTADRQRPRSGLEYAVGAELPDAEYDRLPPIVRPKPGIDQEDGPIDGDR